MSSPATALGTTAEMMVNVFDGTRQLIHPGKDLLYRIIDSKSEANRHEVRAATLSLRAAAAV